MIKEALMSFLDDAKKKMQEQAKNIQEKATELKNKSQAELGKMSDKAQKLKEDMQGSDEPVIREPGTRQPPPPIGSQPVKDSQTTEAVNKAKAKMDDASNAAKKGVEDLKGNFKGMWKK
jgi:hypothetical protein